MAYRLLYAVKLGKERAYVRGALYRHGSHGTAHHVYEPLVYALGYKLAVRETAVQYEGGVWWRDACKHLEHGGTEGIHVHRHGEMRAVTVVAVLLYG